MTARDAATETDPADAVVTDDVAADEPDTASAPGVAADAEARDSDAADAADIASEADTAGEADPADDDDAAAAAPTAKAERRRRKPKKTDDEADDDGSADPAATARPGPSRRTRWIVTALLLVSVLFAGAMVGLYVVNRPAPIAGLSSTQQSAVDAATQAAINLQTFRRASFDQDFANALASLTPDFAQQQLAPRKDALEQQLKDGGRDASATALSAGLVSSTSTQAVVLVVTNTTQTADDGTSTPFVFSRLQLTLQRIDGKWLVSDLKSVGLS